ncbi:MAG: NUDIX hydrolase [Alphaproteobacteria bacterium]|nr:NUDIX hydrolase [Alphaproteobacteria bacterium]
MHTTDWVNVIARTQDGRLVFVEQYRHGTDDVTLEIPGGMVDPGEDFVTAALRELAEETGYRPAPGADAAVIGVVAPNPAIQSNRCGTVLVGPVLPGPSSPDENEELCVRCLDEARVPGLIRDGVITHALVVAAFHHLHLREGRS